MMVSLKTLLEKLGKDATAGDYVKDFKKSDAPKSLIKYYSQIVQK